MRNKTKYVDPFYRSSKWKRKRLTILRRDEYMCQESKRYGKTEPATTVHHIYPRELYPEIELEQWNLLSLCDRQHNAMHDRESHEVTALGREWQSRKQAEFEEFYQLKEK